MSTQPPDPEIEKLLADLRSDYPKRRQTAAEKVAELKLRNDEIINALKAMADFNSSQAANRAAAQALVSLGIVEPPAPAVSSSAQGPSSPRRQFWTGFWVWLLINVPLMACAGFSNIEGRGPTGGLPLLVNFLPLIANIVIITWLAFTPRRYSAFGALTAFGLVLALLLLYSPFALQFCFSWPIVRG